jgi:hypothetical protein
LAIAIDFIYGEKKHTIPMGHLTRDLGYSYHRNKNNDEKPPLLTRNDKNSKINNNEISNN